MQCPRSKTGYATDAECCARICATEHSADLTACLACERGQRLAATSPIQSRPVPVTPTPAPMVAPAAREEREREPWPEVALHPRCRIVAQTINHVLEQFPRLERHSVDYLYSQATMVFCWRRVSRQAFESRCIQAGLTLETRKRKAYVLVDDACHRLAKVYREAQCPNS